MYAWCSDCLGHKGLRKEFDLRSKRFLQSDQPSFTLSTRILSVDRLNFDGDYRALRKSSIYRARKLARRKYSRDSYLLVLLATVNIVEIYTVIDIITGRASTIVNQMVTAFQCGGFL